LVKFIIYESSAFLAQLEARKQKLEQAEHQRLQRLAAAKDAFQARPAEDISAIYTRFSASVACVDDSVGTIARQILKRNTSPFADVIANSTTLRRSASAEATFIALKTRECDAALAPTELLREVVTGLNRDGIPFEYHAGTITAAFQHQFQENERAQAETREKAKEAEQATKEAAVTHRKAEVAHFKTQLILDGVLSSINDDVTVVIAAHDTPRVIRNLSGAPIFTKAATVCFPFGRYSSAIDTSTSNGRFLLDVLEQVKKRGGGRVEMGDCDATNFAQFDLLAFTGAQLDDPDLTPGLVKRVVEAVHEGTFVIFGRYAKSDFLDASKGRGATIANDAEKQAQQREKWKDDFEKRDADAVSAIYLKKPASTICVAGPVDGRLVSRIKATDSPFADLLGSPPGFQEESTAEAIFIAIKERQCEVAVASTKVLREVIKGLNRDEIFFDDHGGSLISSRWP
jgi:hypothetical protein